MMAAALVVRFKAQTAGKSKLELAMVGMMALLLGGGFLYLGASFH